MFYKHNTDKGYVFHNYTRQYASLFEPFRLKPIKYLEIGVLNGGSLKAFREYFSNAELIVGLDIDARCKAFEEPHNDIRIEIGNATDRTFIETIIQKYGKFDIILDDGSHTNRDVIESFQLLFPLMNDNGLYVVEDTKVYKSPNHLVPGYPNHLEYFNQFIPDLNKWRHDSTTGIKDNCIDPYKIQIRTNNVFEYSIDKIEFGCSYIAIHKKRRHHWIS
jgi:cephalosporin hydroxylase